MNTALTSSEPSFLWLRGSEAARRLGLTLEMLESAIRAGQIPLRCTYLGERQLMFCHSGDLAAYLSAWATPARRATHPANITC